jgi:diacylglycerol kinase (ATP)
MRKTTQQGISGRLQSFGHAFRGCATLLTSQPNARIHAIASAMICAIGAALGISVGEWLWIVVAIVLVWSAEAFNTALEFLADAACPDYHPLIGKAKDVAAAAVLIAALGAVVIGMLVLGPYFARLI